MTTSVKTDTKEKIIELATALVEAKGYNGFSYQDISDILKIKKASIHYHFPSKEDLGLAVFDAFRKGVDAYIEQSFFEKLSPTHKLHGYFQYHADIAAQAANDCSKISCIGAMASEWNILPEKLREKVEEFNKWHVRFIVSILEEGIAKGEFKQNGAVEDTAMYVIASTKGALLMAREKQSQALYHTVTGQILRCLKC
ncbi:MAG: TetR/AcrR family transcriptional regulator [Nitrospinae bacterium]|nr:TetR/AcrR family transcriptional regulator [Nitrospinota bacterium]